MPKYDFDNSLSRPELPDVIGKGTRDDTLFRFLCGMQARGFEYQEIVDAAFEVNNERCRPPLPDSAVWQKIRSATSYDKGVTHVMPTPPRPIAPRNVPTRNVDVNVLPDLSGMTPSEQATAYIKAVFENVGEDSVDGRWDNCVCISRDLFHPSDDVFHYAGTLIGLVPGIDMWPNLLPWVDDMGAWVCVNPLKERGNNSNRRKENVAKYMNALVECDDVDKDKQLELILSRFWSVEVDGEPMLRAIVDSGNKSYHAIIRINALNEATYRADVEAIYDTCDAIGLTVDRKCVNPTRMTRLPGAERHETGQMQRLVWAYDC